MSKKAGGARVWRQPIRDRRCRVAAFELLHREQDNTEAHVTDDALATDDVIRLAYDDGGARCPALDTMPGSALPGFVNVDAEMLLSSRVESLPMGHVMLELLETVDVDERIVSRCRELKSLGYGIALDDFCEFRPDLVPLLDVADIVKVDVPQVDDDCLDDLVEKLRRFPLRLLAEKIDSSRRARRCRDLHFDFYQGYYFDMPAPMVGHA